MNITDLKDGMRKLDPEATISDLSEPRTVNLRTGETTQVADAVITDASGSIKLSLWGGDIERVSKGDKIRVSNGYTNSFRDEVRVNVGKFGKLEVL